MINRAMNFVARNVLTRLLLGRVSNSTYFKYIYKFNYWEDPDSRSGPGSNMLYTEEIRKTIPLIFDKFQIESVFDAPCGDFYWMSSVIGKTDISYLGGDLVGELIQQNVDRWAKISNARFTRFDITCDKFPTADLWICRDVHFHLSNADIARSLCEFCQSEIKYVLLTSHSHTPSSSFENTDIPSGGFRLLDMTEFPFNLPKTPLYRFNDYIPPHPAREMLLFERAQIAACIPTLLLNIGMKN